MEIKLTRAFTAEKTATRSFILTDNRNQIQTSSGFLKVSRVLYCF